jgi:hypothetical protein
MTGNGFPFRLHDLTESITMTYLAASLAALSVQNAHAIEAVIITIAFVRARLLSAFPS